MAWYWIVLIVLIYFCMAILTAVMWIKYWDDDDLDIGAIIGIFLWWAVFPYLFVVFTAKWILKKLKK